MSLSKIAHFDADAAGEEEIQELVTAMLASKQEPTSKLRSCAPLSADEGLLDAQARAVPFYDRGVCC